MRKEFGSTSVSERGNQAIEQTQLSMQWKLRKGEQVARYSKSGMLSVLAFVAAIARERHDHRIFAKNDETPVLISPFCPLAT